MHSSAAGLDFTQHQQDTSSQAPLSTHTSTPDPFVSCVGRQALTWGANHPVSAGDGPDFLLPGRDLPITPRVWVLSGDLGKRGIQLSRLVAIVPGRLSTTCTEGGLVQGVHLNWGSDGVHTANVFLAVHATMVSCSSPAWFVPPRRNLVLTGGRMVCIYGPCPRSAVLGEKTSCTGTSGFVQPGGSGSPAFAHAVTFYDQGKRGC